MVVWEQGDVICKVQVLQLQEKMFVIGCHTWTNEEAMQVIRYGTSQNIVDHQYKQV